MKKGFDKSDIDELNKYRSLLNDEANKLLERFNGEEIEGTYELSRAIPLINKIERENEELIRYCLCNWLYDNKYALEYLTDGRITYAGTLDLDTYRFKEKEEN